MQKEIIISDDEYESRCAIVEDGVLSEIEIERRDDEQTLGNVYKGRVENVLPGMQIAFVDIGLDRHAFLHASDIHYDFEAEDIEKDSTKEGLGSNAIDSPRGGRGSSYSISNLLRKNQEILLQVVKEPIGTKGPRVTACVTLPGRFIVYLSTSSSIGVSRRIEAAEERQRLKDIAQSFAFRR